MRGGRGRRGRRWLVGVLSGALVAGVLALPEVPVAAAVAAPAVVPPSLGVGGPASPTGNGAVAEPPATGGFGTALSGPGAPSDLRLDGRSAGSAVRPVRSGFDPVRSVSVSRSEQAEVFGNPDGTRTVHLATQPMYAQVRPGVWSPIDTTLTAAGAADVPAAGKAAGVVLAAGRRAAVHPLENDKPIWPHCDGLIWPHPRGHVRGRVSLVVTPRDGQADVEGQRGAAPFLAARLERSR